MYGVFHIFDVDGGFGDAIDNEELIGVTADLNEAKNFVEKYSLEGAVYDIPYAALSMGKLEIRELKELSDNSPYEDWMVHSVLDEECNSSQIKEKAKSLL